MDDNDNVESVIINCYVRPLTLFWLDELLKHVGKLEGYGVNGLPYYYYPSQSESSSDELLPSEMRASSFSLNESEENDGDQTTVDSTNHQQSSSESEISDETFSLEFLILWPRPYRVKFTIDGTKVEIILSCVYRPGDSVDVCVVGNVA